MAISESLIQEFENEMASTRKTIERIPEEKFDWKAHEKSFSMGTLATHLANIQYLAVLAVEQDSFDFAPVGEPPFQAPKASSIKEVLEMFDQNVALAKAAIAKVSDEDMVKPWSLLTGGKTIFSRPRLATLRNLVLNHTVHHRAQLGVYLRLNDIPVPSIYGPSADENPF
jgi:uncharacterized damage-inducible protein DinB